MDTLKRETYPLPLYDEPLGVFGLETNYGHASDVGGEDETRGEVGESLTLTLSDVDGGRDRLEVVYDHGESETDIYYFDVVDEQYRICAHTGTDTDDVPWPVWRALEKFGLHGRQTPSTPQKFVFNHLLLGVRHLIDQQPDTPLLNACLKHLTMGVSTYAFFGAFETQLSDPEFAAVTGSFAEHAEEMQWWEPDFDEEVAEHIYSGSELDAPVWLPQPDWRGWVSPDADRTAQTDRPESAPITTVELTTDSAEEYVFATHISRYGIDRYRFAIKGEGRLAKEHDGMPDFPPYSILRALQNAGYELENIPTFGPSTGLGETLEQVDELIRWITKRYEFENRETIAAYSRYITRLEPTMLLVALYEHDPDAYHAKRQAAFADADISLDGLPETEVPYEVVKDLALFLIQQYDEETFQVAEDRIEALNLRERIEAYERQADQFEDDEPLSQQ